jgi:hypothetical protein
MFERSTKIADSTTITKKSSLAGQQSHQATSIGHYQHLRVWQETKRKKFDTLLYN